MRVAIATTNPGKAREIVDAFDDAAIEFCTLADFPTIPEPHETEPTFEGNAVLKAKHYAHYTGVMTLAEDSGLEVDALGGEPGVYSARYAGEPCDDAANNAKVLERMHTVPEGARTARFVSVFALVTPDGDVRTARGAVEGRIAYECRGTEGFGYDSVFIPDGYEQTFGELGLPVKRTISHRSRSLAKIIPLLRAAAGAH